MADRDDRAAWEAEMFRLLAENVRDYAIFLVDPTRHVLSWSKGAERLLGFTEAEIVGRRCDAFFTPEDVAAGVPQQELDEALRSGRGEDDRWHLRKDGSRFWAGGVVTPLRDDAGRLRGFAKIMRDRTELKRAADAGRARERQLQFIADHTPVMIAQLGPDPRFRFVNRLYAERFGRQPRDVVGLHVRDLLGEAAYARVRPHMEAALAGRRVEYEADVPYEDIGTQTMHIVYAPEVDAAGTVVGYVAAIRNVTEQRRAEAALREENRVAEALHRIGGILAAELDLQKLVQAVTDEATKITDAEVGAFFYNVRNDHGEAYTLYAISGVPREAFAQVPMPRNTGIFEPTFRGEGPVRLDDVTADPRYGQNAPHQGMPAGHLPVRSYLAVPVVSRSGEVLGGLFFGHSRAGVFGERDERIVVGVAAQAAVAIDNARLYQEARSAGEQLRRSNDELAAAARQKDEFLAMLAHELRNPLAPIRNAAQVIRLLALADPNVQRATGMIERQLAHLARLVDDLLDVSRITSGKITLRREPTDLSAVVTQAVETSRPLIDERRHTLTETLPPEPVPVKGDATRLAQVIDNLLNNAAKYTPEGGRIDLALAREGATAAVRVRDTGAGIPPEMLPHVFGLFTQVDRTLDRSQGGLGIGLTLVKRLTEMHGGTVHAFSAGPGQGSEFVVRLPMIDGGPRSTAAPADLSAAPTRRQPLRVLVVDDNVDAAESLAMLLRVEGHEVEAVHDGPSALAAARRFRPQVVLLDLGLPGMDGHEVARRLRQEPDLGPLRLVALTGYGQDDDRRRSQAAGFDAHLVKPASPEALQQVLAGPPE